MPLAISREPLNELEPALVELKTPLVSMELVVWRPLTRVREPAKELEPALVELKTLAVTLLVTVNDLAKFRELAKELEAVVEVEIKAEVVSILLVACKPLTKVRLPPKELEPAEVALNRLAVTLKLEVKDLDKFKEPEKELEPALVEEKTPLVSMELVVCKPLDKVRLPRKELEAAPETVSCLAMVK